MAARKLKRREDITRAQAIRLKCLNCVCFIPSEVRKCHIEECALWPYRMGKGYEHTDAQVDIG